MVEVGHAPHPEAQVIEADTVLVETVAPNGPIGGVVGADAQAHLTVAQEGSGIEIHELLEPQDVGVEGDRLVNVAHCQSEVMHASGGNVLRHASSCAQPIRQRRSLTSRGPRICSTVSAVAAVVGSRRLDNRTRAFKIRRSWRQRTPKQCYGGAPRAPWRG